MTLAYLLAAIDDAGDDHISNDRSSPGFLPRPLPAADNALLARLRANDTTAFDEIVRAHAQALIGFGTTVLGRREAAEDVVQDLFLWLWDHRDTFTLSGSLRTYLLTAVRRRALNVIAHQDVVTRNVLKLGVEAPTTDVRDADAPDDATLWAAVHALPLRWREAITLRYVGGLSFAEVGRVLSISDAAARMLVQRGVTELRRQLA